MDQAADNLIIHGKFDQEYFENFDITIFVTVTNVTIRR